MFTSTISLRSQEYYIINIGMYILNFRYIGNACQILRLTDLLVIETLTVLP